MPGKEFPAAYIMCYLIFAVLMNESALLLCMCFEVNMFPAFEVHMEVKVLLFRRGGFDSQTQQCPGQKAALADANPGQHPNSGFVIPPAPCTEQHHAYCLFRRDSQ